MTSVDWSALSDALLRVERLSEEESGMLAFGMSDSGGVLVERGRVCFVGARGLGQRLRESLPDSNADATPFGSMAPPDLEQALRRHSAECLLELCRNPLPTRWAAHAGPLPADSSNTTVTYTRVLLCNGRRRISV